MSGTGNLVNVFKHHFTSQLKGGVPYQKGFIVIGKLPVHRREYAGPSMNNQALQAAAPGVAAVDQARERVGGNGQARVRRTNSASKRKASSGSGKKGGANSKNTKKKKTTAPTSWTRPCREAI